MSNNLFDIYNYNVFPKFNVNLNFKYNNYNPKDEEINLQQTRNRKLWFWYVIVG